MSGGVSSTEEVWREILFFPSRFRLGGQMVVVVDFGVFKKYAFQLYGDVGIELMCGRPRGPNSSTL